MLILILILPYLVRGLLPLLPNYRPPRLPVVTSENGKKDSVSSQQEADSSPSSIFPTRLSLTTLPPSGDSSFSSTVGPSTSLPRQSSATEVSTVKSDKPTRQETRWKDHLKKGKGKKDRKSDSDKRGKRRKSSYYELPEDRYDSLTGMSIPMYPQRQPPSPPPSRPVSSYPSTSTATSTSSTSTTASTVVTTSTVMTTTTAVPSTTTKPNLVALKMNRSLIVEVGHSVWISKPNQKICRTLD